MKKMNLVQKIGGGFGLVLLLVLIVSAISWNSLKSLSSGQNTYKKFVDHANISYQIQTDMLMVQMNVKDYIISGDDKDIKDYNTFLSKVEDSLAKEKEAITSKNLRKDFDTIVANLDSFKAAFKKIIALKQKRKILFNDQLAVIGTSIAADLAQIMDTANNDRDEVATYLAAMAIRNLLLGRIYVFNFMETGDIGYASKADDVLTQFDSFAKKMSILLQDESGRETAKKNREQAKKYAEIFKELVATLEERDVIASEILDNLGPKIIKGADAITLAVNKEQDNLGQALQGKAANSQILVFVIAVVGLVGGSVLAFLLTRAITKPILKTAAFAETLAAGDFSSSLDIDQNDEIGKMSKSLNHMIVELGTMLKDIIGGIHTLSESSNELKTIAVEMSANSADTSEKSTAVAAAAEEMSSNMNSVAAAMEQASSNTSLVASATEEMTLTVDKIAEGAGRAREISSTAVEQSTATSVKMEDLGEAASKIGRVTETITEISEQTNLLALNATIEAARAGEAGKGFAVVANEIKELAKQTAEATVDIKNQIDSMQNTTSSTIDDIQKISEIINEINEVINTIHQAVNEQASVTQEITENINQSSMGISEVNENVAQATVVVADISKDISEVNVAAVGMNSSSSHVEESADKLSTLAHQLNKMVARFKV